MHTARIRVFKGHLRAFLYSLVSIHHLWWKSVLAGLISSRHFPALRGV